MRGASALEPSALVATPSGEAFVAAKEKASTGAIDSIVLLHAMDDGKLRAEETPFDGLPGLAILAAEGAHLVASTSDGRMHVLTLSGEIAASWAASEPFHAGVSVGDLDGDRRTETVVCRVDETVAAQRWDADQKQFQELWQFRWGRSS